MFEFLTEEDIRDICYQYAKVHLTYDEPIPSFETRYPEKLEAVLASPQTQVGGKHVHSSLSRKVAVLFYEMIKQHPFLNGNKRIACVATMVTLSLNGKWLETDWENLYEIAVSVAQSKSGDRSEVLKSLTDFIQGSIVKK
ncbi:MAG: type II toxin-antitoxin system death-on-curing family toxin [Patescibacteria group bacterium]|nr:type II toxin-antitoxin system death-on-curing family toxin [Patescibacteria group bacterium]MBU2509668.1 type II toxin-antitoxin system death-on-curing family toxin [Patescibacteria group bacterium]